MAAIVEPPENGSNNASLSVNETDTEEAVGIPGAAVTGEAEQLLIANPSPAPETEKWPGWPGHCVFRLIVPVSKVGSIIGRKGELIKKLCEETRARVRVLDGALGTSDRIVLISGKEEPEAPLSPAMVAVFRVFKRVNALPDNDAEGDLSGPAGAAPCSSRLLVASSQAVNLIGKQGSVIKSIQESSGASVRVLSADETPSYATPDEKIVEIQGEALKVVKALEAVVEHLRKFLLDPTVLPLFEKINNPTVSQDRQVEAWPDKSSLPSTQPGIGIDFPLSLQKEALFLDREAQLESRFGAPVLSSYGQESGLSSLRSMGIGRAVAPMVTQVAQTMQIPLSYAEDIIGTAGSNIAYIRRSSGATITVQESRGLPDEITVEIKGTSSEVQSAQQLIQEFINNHKEPFSSSYDKIDSGYRRSPYGQLSGNTNYASSSLPLQQPYGGGSYGSSGVGGGGGHLAHNPDIGMGISGGGGGGWKNQSQPHSPAALGGASGGPILSKKNQLSPLNLCCSEACGANVGPAEVSVSRLLEHSRSPVLFINDIGERNVEADGCCIAAASGLARCGRFIDDDDPS
ncbi:hypothetical protein V2J09_018793 [Rumex salicifolius]